MFVLALLLQTVLAPFVFAEETAEDKPSLVALGDSITFGWNLYGEDEPDKSKPSKHAFPNYILDGAFDVTNLSFPGWTSGDLLGQIKTNPVYLPAITEADVITLNIGNNDLLKAADINNLLNNPEPLTDEKIAEITEKIEAASIQLYSNLAQIMGAIRGVNQDAPILFYNTYNPFGSHMDQVFPGLHLMGEKIILGVNENVIHPIATDAPGTILLDAYSAYNGKQGDYILPNDVHPTIAGQKVLASLADQALFSLLPPELPELEIELTATPTESTEGPVTVAVATNHEEISEMKWLPGELEVEDFENEGNEISLSNPVFEVTENGVYTVYVLSETGEKKVSTIQITNIEEKVVEPPVVEPPIVEPPHEVPPAEEEPPAEEPKKEEPAKNEQKVTPEKTETKSGPKLPNTASPLYNMLAFGIATIVIGSALLFMYFRRNRTV